VPLGAVRLDELAACWRLTALAAQRFPEHGNPGLRRDHQGHHDVMAVGPMIPPLAAREVPDRFVGGVVAVIAAIHMEAGAIERHNVRGKASTRGRRGRHETIACGDARRIERL
jgi:hypothetical protein